MSLLNLTALSIAEIFGDFKFKNYAKTDDFGSLVQGIGCYFVVIYFLIKAFRDGNVIYVNGMWDGLSALVETLAAYYILGERLNSIDQYFGIVLICVGIIVLHSGGISK